ncbi:MAG: Ribosomal RNA small subunit methyltransferase D [Calditrichaeota bacterium]|nr:Ribosomal RNA small subunit methyltransferase D [Calditrichota bacterium]
MRLTGGEGKGRLLLDAPPHIRPTSGRIREQLFFMLRDRLPGAAVLDLYAGTGSLGLEALARGARLATFVERDRDALRVIRRNVKRCGFQERAVVVAGDVFQRLRQRFVLRGPFDLILADPPYEEDVLVPLLETIDRDGLLTPGGLVIYETKKHEQWVETPPWRLVDERRVGGTRLLFADAGQP